MGCLRKYFAFANFKTVGLLHRPHFPPLVKSIGRDEAAFPKNRMSKCRRRCDGLRPCVERFISDAHVFRPGRNQSPTHCREVSNFLTVLSTHSQDWLRRSNVVSRTILKFSIRSLKALGKVLLRVRQSVSVTHPIILADSEAVSLNRIPALLPFLAKPCA